MSLQLAMKKIVMRVSTEIGNAFPVHNSPDFFNNSARCFILILRINSPTAVKGIMRSA